MGSVVSVVRRVYPSSKKTNGVLPMPHFGEECVICLEYKGSVVFWPCKHVNVCLRCAHLLISYEKSRCPTCRAKIDRVYAFVPQVLYDLKN